LVAIADTLSSLKIKAVCAAIPRPNQAFWTLSALWAGWLWGREAVGSFKSVLHRQRYDWAWHTTALASVYKQLNNILGPDEQIFGIIGETELGYITSALVSAGFAGCNLQGIAIQEEDSQAQLLWKCNPVSDTPFKPLVESGITSAKSYLESRGEPASYLNTISAALINIIEPTEEGKNESSADKKSRINAYNKKSDLKDKTEATPALAYSQAYTAAKEALSYRSGFLRFTNQDITQLEVPETDQGNQETLFSSEIGKKVTENEQAEDELSASESNNEQEHPARSPDVSESELIWLRDSEKANRKSASDNYELTFQNYLVTHPGCSEQEIYSKMCERFPGLFTPEPEFIRLLLESYGEKDKDLWYIREEDKPNERQKDMDTAQNLIHQIANQLLIKSEDMKSSNIPYIAWEDDAGGLNFKF
jgi:hypothetical protein